MTYQEADKLLTGRCKNGRKLGNNTYLERSGDDIAVRLHWTHVVTMHPDGSYTLNTNGWHTVTSKDRINSYSPVGIFQKDFTWYVGRWDSSERIEYNDGVRLVPENGGYKVVAP